MKKLLVVLCCILALQSCNNGNTGTETVNGFDINWSGNLSKKDQDAVKEMISNMVKVEAGTFMMGAQNDTLATSLESPAHEVAVGEFYINKYEVTQALWEAVMGKHNDKSDDFDQWEEKFGKGYNYPAYRISFNDVELFIGMLNEYTGLSFALPTEAQWEYAARGGKDANYEFIYAGSNVVTDVAWIDTISNKCSEIGKKTPNALGLYDMSGNVWEMCSNWYYDYSSVCDTITPGDAYTGHKVFRGGSWNTNAQSARVTARYKQGIHYRDYNTGFRLVLE